MATPPEVDQDQNMYMNFDSKAYISIPEFYAGRSIMITGGTGFMGKVIHCTYYSCGISWQSIVFIIKISKFWILCCHQVLVEKLLRSCPEIQNIYLLMRPKRGQEVSARLNELLNSPVSMSA